MTRISLLIAEARSARCHSNCAKQKLGVVVVKDGEIISRGWNTCRCGNTPRDIEVQRDRCPRLALPSGEGYALAHAVHAEVTGLLHIRPRRALQDFERCLATVEPTLALIEDLFTDAERSLLYGATLYLYGHTYACDACKRWCELLGIREIIIDTAGVEEG